MRWSAAAVKAILGMGAVASLVLGGCATDPEPVEPTASPTTSAAPTLAPPTRPAAADEDTVEGANAFIRYWIATLNYAARTGDVEQLRFDSDQSCESCSNYIAAFAAAKPSNRLQTDLWTVDSEIELVKGESRWDGLARISEAATAGGEEFSLGIKIPSEQPFRMLDIYRIESQ